MRGSLRQHGYDESGWTTYERCSAEQIKSEYRFEANWKPVTVLGKVDPVTARRSWPVGPDDFDKLIATRSFTNGADRDAVRALFRAMSQAQLAGVTELRFKGMQTPRRDDIASLGGCLALCTSLQRLGLKGIALGDQELEWLAEALLAATERGGLGRLRWLHLEDNLIGDQGATALAGALPALLKLKLESVTLNSNMIGTKGSAALKKAWGDRRGLFL